jgi:hypothetical protein
MEESVSLLSTQEEKVIKTHDNKKSKYDFCIYNVLCNHKATYFVLNVINNNHAFYKEVYTNNFKVIKEDVEYPNISIINNGSLYINDNNELNIYNKKGDLINKIDDYDIKMLINKYIVGVKDKKLIITTLEDESVEVTSWDNKKQKLVINESGIDVYDGKYRIFLVVNDSTLNIDTVWKYCKNHLEECNIKNKSDLNKKYLSYKYYYIPETGELNKVPIQVK